MKAPALRKAQEQRTLEHLPGAFTADKPADSNIPQARDNVLRA
jgi:hypothetical protein